MLDFADPPEAIETVDGLTETVGPLTSGGDTETPRLTDPANVLLLVTETVTVPIAPELILKLGRALR
jgi:hypothetical protein